MTRAGEVYVDRTIKAPIDMEYRVRVQAKTPQGWRTVCEGRDGPIHYLPDMAIDQPVTLEWWSGGACEAIPQGPARIVTTWAPRTLDPVTVISEVEG